MAWLAEIPPEPADRNVIPLDDLKEHVKARTCWCRPIVEDRGQHCLIVHHALDGRELSEPDFLPEYQERPH